VNLTAVQPLSFVAAKEDEGKPIAQVVFTRLKVSRRLFSSIKFQNGLLVNGIPTHTSHKVHAGETIALLLPEYAQSRRLPQAVPLDISYEDADLLIVSKPAPLPSQASARQGTDTLENYTAAYLSAEGPFVYRPVNRLDKGVSGLMVIAKNAFAQHRLQCALHTPSFVREYLAVTEGLPEPADGTIEAPIGKVTPAGIKRCITPDGKPSITHYETLETKGTRGLIKLRLQTGRTHQIRVHLASIGCPVTGDFLYGRETDELPGRIALHSYHVSLVHPVTGKLTELYSQLPASLKNLLK